MTEHHRTDPAGYGADRIAPSGAGPTGWPASASAGLPYGPGLPGGPPATPARTGGRLRMGVSGLVAAALIGGGAGAGTVVLMDRAGVGTAGTSPAQEVVIENPQTATTATAAAAKAAPSVVTVYVQGRDAAGSGSGVVLTEDGFVLTNNHVVAAAGQATVQVRTADGELYEAKVVGADPSADLAVIRLAGASGLTPATFADSDQVQVGDVAVAIGAPLGLTNTVTSGIISATNRAVSLGASGDDATVIDALQTDAAINPGNSGGALVNGAGEVVGINTAIATVAGGLPGSSEQSGNIGVGFAVPSNAARRIADELIENGQARRALLGVTARTASAEGSAMGSGAQIVSVEPGSAADEAGLQPGDVVTAIDERPITTSTELTAAVRSRTPGETVEITVRRDDEVRTVQVSLGSTS